MEELSTPCMACDRDIVFSKQPKIGFQVSCKNCETEYVVIALNPIELEWVFDDDFDEDDYRDYEYDEYDDLDY